MTENDWVATFDWVFRNGLWECNINLWSKWQEPPTLRSGKEYIAGEGNSESTLRGEWVWCEGGIGRPVSLKPSSWGRGVTGGIFRACTICRSG